MRRVVQYGSIISALAAGTRRSIVKAQKETTQVVFMEKTVLVQMRVMLKNVQQSSFVKVYFCVSLYFTMNYKKIIRIYCTYSPQTFLKHLKHNTDV